MPVYLNSNSELEQFQEELRQAANKIDPSLNINLRQSTSRKEGKKEINAGQYTIEIFKGGKPDKANTFYGTISKADNNTVLLKQGVGYQLIEGELKNKISDKGIEGDPDAFTGTESFIRRVSGAFTLKSQDEGSSWQKTLKSYFHEINTGLRETGMGVFIRGLGHIAKSQNYLQPEVAPQKMQQLTNSLSVNLETKSATTVAENIFQTFKRKTKIGDPFEEKPTGRAAWDNAVLDVQHQKLVLQGAYGTLVQKNFDESDPDSLYWGVDLLTEKGFKQSYVQSSREFGKLYGVGQDKAVEIQSPNLVRKPIAYKPNQTPSMGLKVKAAFALNTLPMQSGMGQFQLPEDVRQELTSQGLSLGVGMAAHETIRLGGIEDLDFIANNFSVSKNVIGSIMKPGQSKRVASYTQPSGKKKPINIQNQEQIKRISGMSVILPAYMEDDYATYSEQIEKFEKAGLNIEYGGEEDISLRVSQDRITPGAIKNIIKMGANIPFLSGAKQEIRGVKGHGNIPYDLLTHEVKSSSALALGFLEALPQTGENNLFDLLRDLHPDDPNIEKLNAYQQANVSSGYNILETGKALGYRSPEYFLDQMAQKLFTKHDEKIYSKYGIGVIEGEVPIQEFTPKTLKRFKEESILAEMRKSEGKLTRAQAKKVVDEKLKGKLDYYDTDAGKIIVQRGQGKFIVGSFLSKFVEETAGRGSDTGLFGQAMEAMKQSQVANFLKSNLDRLYPNSPGREAMKRISAGYLHTAAMTLPDPTKTVLIGRGLGEGTVEAEDLVHSINALDPDMTPVEQLEQIGKTINKMAGVGENSPRRLYHFPGQSITTADSSSFLEADSYSNEINAEGEMRTGSQAQVASQQVRMLRDLALAESEGVRDSRLREKAMKLSKPFTKSDSLMKRIGGIFARTVGSSLIPGEEVIISENAMKRAFLIGGGDFGKKGDWENYQQQYKRGKMYGLGNRAPTTVMGTAEHPGSISLLQINSPFQKLGKMVQERYQKAGQMQPDIIQSMGLITTMGDFDLDPYTLLPLAYKDEEGKWNKFRPKFLGSKKEIARQYKEWNQNWMASFSPEKQRETFDYIMGDRANEYNPYDTNLVGYFDEVGLGPQAQTWANTRMSEDIVALNKGLMNYRQQKTEAMGIAFRTFITNMEEESQMLSIPEASVVSARDKGGLHYQTAVDTSHAITYFERALSNAGFWPDKGNEGQLTAGFVIPKPGGQPGEIKNIPFYTVGQGKDSFVRGFANILGGNQEALDAPQFADLFTEIGEKPEGVSQEDWNTEIENKRARVAKIVSESEGFFNPDDSTNRLKTIRSLQEQKLIGMQSPGMQALVTRLSEYGQNDPVKLEEIRKAAKGRIIDITGDKLLNFDEFRESRLHNRMLKEFSKGRKGNDAEWLNIPNMASLFLSARDKPESRLIRNLWQNYGKEIGFSNPWESNLTLGGEPVLRAGETVEQMKKRLQKRINDEFTDFASGNRMRIGKASTIGSIAKYEPGDLYTAGPTFKESALLGWQDPTLRMQGIKPYDNPKEWEAIFGEEPNAGMKMGTYVEGLWNEAMAEEGSNALGYAPKYIDTESPRGRFKSATGQVHELATRPDVVKIEKLPSGKFNVGITDFKNIEMNAEERIKGYTPQQLAYAAEVAKGKEANPALIQAILRGATNKQGVVDPVYKEFLEQATISDVENVKADIVSTSVPAKLNEAGEATTDNPEAVKKLMKETLGKISRGEEVKFGKVTTLFTKDASTIGELESETIDWSEKAQTVKQENLIPSAEAELGKLKSYAAIKYPQLQGQGGIDLNLTSGERKALNDLSPDFLREGEKSGLNRMLGRTNLTQEETQRKLYEHSKKVSSLRLQTGQGLPDERVVVRPTPVVGDPRNVPVAAAGGGGPPNDNTGGGGGGGVGGGGSGPNNPPNNPPNNNNWNPYNTLTNAKLGVAALSVTAPEYGVVNAQGEYTPGPAMQVFQNLPQSLARAFESQPGDISQRIASAATPMQAVQIAQQYATENRISFKQVLSSLPGVQRYANSAEQMAKEARAVMKFKDNVEIEEAMNAHNINAATIKPLSGGTVATGTWQEAEQMAQGTFSHIKTLMSQGNQPGVKEKLEITEEGQYKMAASVEQFRSFMKEIEQSKSKFADSKKGISELNKELVAISENTKDFRKGDAKKLSNAIKEAQIALSDATVDISKTVRGRVSGERFSPEEHKTALEKIATSQVSEKEGAAYLKAYSEEQLAELGALDKISQTKDPNLRLSSLARKMFGGFGLMYMGSIANIAATPMKFGYGEATEREQIFDKTLAQSMGGLIPTRNVEEDIKYAKSLYGGTGWTAARSMYADLLKEKPAGAEALNVVQAMFGGAAMAGWVGGMALPAGTAMAPIMAGVGLAVGASSIGLSAYGAYKEKDKNVLSVFTNSMRQGNVFQGGFFDQQGRINQSMITSGEVPLTSALGFQASEEQQSMAQKLQGLREYYHTRSGGKKDGASYLQETYGIGTDEANKLVNMYIQAAGGMSDLGLSFEAYAAAGMVKNKYGLSMAGESPLDTFGALYQQGFDVEGIASIYTSNRYQTYGEAQTARGDYLKQLDSGYIRPPTAGQLAMMETGDQRYQAMGMVAPNLTGTALIDYKASLGAGTQTQYEAFMGRVSIAQLRQQMDLDYELPDVKEYMGEPEKEVYKQTFRTETEEEFKERVQKEVDRIRNEKGEGLTAGFSSTVSKGINSFLRLVTEGELGGTPEEADPLLADMMNKMSPMQIPTLTLDYTIPAVPGMTEKQALRDIRKSRAESYTEGIREKIDQAYMNLGFEKPQVYTGTMNNAQLLNQLRVTNIAEELNAGAVGVGGMGTEANWMTTLSPQQAMQAQRLASFNPLQWTTTLQSMNPFQASAFNVSQMTLPGGSVIDMKNLGRMMDINMQGQATGLSWGRTSLASGSMSGLQNANDIFGSDWSKYGAGSGVINAMVSGHPLASGEIVGGEIGAAQFMSDEQYKFSTAQIGIQMQQIALNKAFTTGVGLEKYADIKDLRTGQPFGFNTSGGGFWGLEDRSRALGYQQQEYGFQMQEQQMNMNDKFFWQNFGVNYQQSMMQRDWSRQDWGYQDQTRSMQWGWKQEDYQENVRFLTGRDRRLAERQMTRETTMYNLEGEQIDKQRERQEELWGLEDVRFDIQRNQHEESLQMQRDQLEKSKEFYEENKKLQEEQTQLSRAYWTEQIRLSEASAGASAAAAKAQKDFNDTMNVLSLEQERIRGQLNLLNEETWPIFLKYLEDFFNSVKDNAYSDVENPNDSGVPGLEPIDPNKIPKAAGGPVSAGVMYEINDVLGGEGYIPNRSGNIVPLSNSSVWGANISQEVSSVPQFINMIVYLGDDLLMKKVVEVVNSEVRID